MDPELQKVKGPRPSVCGLETKIPPSPPFFRYNDIKATSTPAALISKSQFGGEADLQAHRKN
jgi:hypothetical protein